MQNGEVGSYRTPRTLGIMVVLYIYILLDRLGIEMDIDIDIDINIDGWMDG